MDDDKLLHLCKLATISVAMIRNKNFDPSDFEGTVKNQVNMYRILADAFVELQRRQGIKPHFGKSRNG